MSRKPIREIARPRATFGFAMPFVAVKPQVRGDEPSRDPERWSG